MTSQRDSVCATHSPKGQTVTRIFLPSNSAAQHECLEQWRLTQAEYEFIGTLPLEGAAS